MFLFVRKGEVFVLFLTSVLVFFAGTSQSPLLRISCVLGIALVLLVYLAITEHKEEKRSKKYHIDE